MKTRTPPIEFFAIPLERKKYKITDADLGLELHFKGQRFRISETNQGELTLRSLDGCLIIKPKAGNVIEIQAEE